MIGVCVSIPGPVKFVKSGTLGTLATVKVVWAFPQTGIDLAKDKVATSPAAVIVAAVVVPWH
jgi:hypothetical protein